MADRTAWTTATPVPGKGFARQMQAYGGAATIVAGLPGYQYTAETEILWTTTTASATAAAGTVTIYLVGYLD